MAVRSTWGVPPIEKIPEAFSAIADNRVLLEESSAKICSSDYAKEYTITWVEDTFSANDNASYYQGYLGYPVIAVLMSIGRIEYSEEIANYFKGINWKALNSQYKNKYDIVVAMILNDMRARSIDVELVNKEINCVYEQVKVLCRTLKYKRSRLTPPKGSK